jgi:lipoate-protein ligase A
MSGEDNMRLDAECLTGVEQGHVPATLRFFRFKKPTLSYGRLQKFDDILPLVPAGWASVQRPTGGGIVLHQGDLCFSLCWTQGQAPLREKPQEQYRWIHSIVLEALAGDALLPAGAATFGKREAALVKRSVIRMAACGDMAEPKEPFSVRTCFQNPVGYDLLQNQKKVVGGALRCTRRATLYQGSLQMTVSPKLEERLKSAFQIRLAIS